MLKANRKHTIILVLAAMFLCGFTFNRYYISGASVIGWGYDAGDGRGPLLRAQQWVGPDGTDNRSSMQPGTGTRMILYPNPTGVMPQVGAISEITVYGMTDQAAGHPETNFERFSVTQMDPNERMVRFSMERGGTGNFHPIEICFDSYQPGVAYCPLRIDPDPAKGVQVCDINNACTRLGG